MAIFKRLIFSAFARGIMPHHHKRPFGSHHKDPFMWIQKAIKKKGALRAYVKRRYGKKGFTPKGSIKVSILKKLAKHKGKLGKRARLALTLRKLRE